MLILLAMEASTAEPSLALIRDGEPAGERHWAADRGDAGRGIGEIRALLDEARLALADVTHYAVGLGPGGFTGLRGAIATVQALALPSRTPVIGIGSAEAAAAAIRRETGTDGPVVILGDARRDHLWMLVDEGAGADRSVRLIPVEQVGDRLPAGGIVATPDWQRLHGLLEHRVPPTVTLYRRPCIPRADELAHLALARTGTASSPAGGLEPIYLHPPVFTPPRFPPPEANRPEPTP